MFNTTLNINAVNGTLCKNYKDSFIIQCQFDSNMAKALFPVNARDKAHMYDVVAGGYRENRREVVVIQTMLCGDNRILAEIMWKEDFEKMFEIEVDE